MKNKKFVFSLFLIALLTLGALVQPWANLPVSAVTEEELRNKTTQLEQQIADSEVVLNDLEQNARSLENTLNILQTEINVAQQRINLTATKIDELTIELEKTITELERQKGILAENLRTLYIEGDSSTVELIFSAENFGEFFQEQQYLERLKVSIQDSTEKIEDLKRQIESEKQQQEDLQVEQQEQRDILAGKRSEQQNLLDQTRGEEARYQSIVENLRAELFAAQEELEELLRNKNFVSLGRVSRGDIIGYVGSTGFSFGPHLHFALYDGGFVDPYAGGGMSYGLSWPLPTISTDNITQYFGCVAPYDWYYTKCANGNSLHAGLDVGGWYGEPIAAAGDGDIVFRGVLGGYGNAVIIDHGGYQTYYAHMQD